MLPDLAFPLVFLRILFTILTPAIVHHIRAKFTLITLFNGTDILMETLKSLQLEGS